MWKVGNYFPHIETRKVITFRIFDAGSKMEFPNNSLKTPKIGKLNIDTYIIPQGLMIHEKNPDKKISCYCPFKGGGRDVRYFWNYDAISGTLYFYKVLCHLEI